MKKLYALVLALVVIFTLIPAIQPAVAGGNLDVSVYTKSTDQSGCDPDGTMIP